MKPKKPIDNTPGAVVFIGNKKVERIQIHQLSYDAHSISDKELDNHSKLIFEEIENKVDWFDFRGLHDTKLIEHVGHSFSIHPLVQSDIANTLQRPSFEAFENALFITIKSLTFIDHTKKIHAEHISFYLTDEYILSFQEDHSDIFYQVRNRLMQAKGQVRSKGTDYLLFALLDTIIDNYFLVIDTIADEIEAIETEILESSNKDIRQQLHYLRKEIQRMYKHVSAFRDSLSRLLRSDSSIITDSCLIYYRNAFDLTLQTLDRLENQKEYANGLQDLYLSEVSNKMNEIMKVLTVITTFFVPLSFLVGVYGMNFQNMPELSHPYGYFILISVMAIISIGLFIYFKQRKWL